MVEVGQARGEPEITDQSKVIFVELEHKNSEGLWGDVSGSSRITVYHCFSQHACNL